MIQAKNKVNLSKLNFKFYRIGFKLLIIIKKAFDLINYIQDTLCNNADSSKELVCFIN